MINCNKGHVTLDGSGEQITTELIIVLMSVYESIKDATDEEVASYVIDKAYIKAKKEIDKDKERNM